jgi:hypothetical protein
MEPTNVKGLSALIPAVENLERRKRYLNFKFIRDHVINTEEFKAGSSEEADALLSEAIDCGLIVKRKIEDKYNSGQFFTAYTLNRESALYERYSQQHPSKQALASEPEKQEKDLDTQKSDAEDEARTIPRYGSGQQNDWSS